MPRPRSDSPGIEPDCITECHTAHGYWWRFTHSNDEPQATLTAAIMIAGDVAATEARKSGKTYLVASAKLPSPAIYVFAGNHPDAANAGMKVMFEFSPSGSIRRIPPTRH
jgi:hypothetical protein